MKKIMFSLGGALVLFFFAASDIFACSCGKIRRIQEEVSEKTQEYAEPIGDLVFTGKVVSVRKGMLFVYVSFRVDKVWKGNDVQTLTIYTGNANNYCGYPFKKGEKYLVDANRSGKDKFIYTDICSKTTKITGAGETLKILGEGRLPIKSQKRKKIKRR